MPELRFEYFSSVQQRNVDWLWYPYIPYGKITILQGDPGEGKSTFVINLVALLTNGEKMPDGSGGNKAHTVIYQCAEDDIADTIKPRLVEAGADCDKVAYIIDEDTELTFEDSRIEEVLRKTGAKLLVIDPIQAFLGQDNDMQSASKMRTTLRKIADVASRYKCAVILVGHLNKSYAGKNLYRGLGSIDIAAIARSILMISRDKANPTIRYMFPVKSSLAPEGCAVSFTFIDGKFKWIGTCDLDSDSIEESVSVQSKKLTQTKRFLLQILKDGDLPSSKVFEKVERIGIKKRTTITAKKELGIKSYKKNNIWYWQLPELQTVEESNK